MTEVWFTSDPHLGHRRVAEIRGFHNTALHDATIMSQWEAYVRPGDQVWVLGDLCASSPDYALELIRKLPGEKHLIAGNHDQVHPMHRDAFKRYEKYLSVFKTVQPFARRRILGEEVLLSHFPYFTDRGEPRYTQYRLRDEGRFLLHGHTHSDQRYTGPIEMHVGVDAWDLTPVPMAEVAAWVKNQKEARELGYPELSWTTNFEEAA